MFTLIDFENWERKEHYLHFYNDVRCSYSTCVNIDISNLNGQRLYPAMLWLLTQTVNEMPEFRTALTEKGLGYFSEMHPAYTIFNQEQETFSGILCCCNFLTCLKMPKVLYLSFYSSFHRRRYIRGGRIAAGIKTNDFLLQQFDEPSDMVSITNCGLTLDC